MFWWEDVASNAELSPGGASDRLFPFGWGGRIEKIDDFTIAFRYDRPYGLLITRLAAVDGADMARHPRHYLEQFHIKYNPDADQQAKDLGYNTWVEYFGQRADWLVNPEMPTFWAWKVTSPYGSDAQQVIVERNPYYFKVDPEGNQLPYIDRIVYDIVANNEVLLLKILNGEVDMHGDGFNTLANKAVVVDNQERGGYTLFDQIQQLANISVIFLNLTFGDPVKREIFQNKDFRIGLSYAINRQEIIDAIYFGQSIPYQQAPRPESPYYNERLATQYTEYNVDLANEHLDKAGYSERDSDGFRLGPDGQRIVINGESSTADEGADRVAVFELIKGYWAAVGIDLQTKQEEHSLFWSRRGANLHEAIIWSGNGGMYPIIQEDRYLPVNSDAQFAMGWQAWYNDPGSEMAMEPSEPAKQQQALWDEIRSTADTERQAELMREILEIAADEFYHIGTCLWPNAYGIVKHRFHNVPNPMPRGGGGDLRYFTPSNSCQYFIEE
jgi:peptide/nickel transport system substrate-binding protein